ncbi:hypothetical protein M0R89_10475 [Halorussus limi]|uniref:Uncharacterized protein n=1 Tax=Halorussus limi TaxID=2938695 RepID=A0A8U0HQF3_9EURY|nr:hypothetical protein [Halorussus limi]UPV72973.1 hypothetical protein M0R89_10475 [Halorussus limi]
MKFKIELTDEKVKIIANERSFVFETTSDGVTVGPDFTESNRHATILPGGKKNGKWGDYGIHVTEPNDEGENESITDSTYWRDDLETEAYLFTRTLGTARNAMEFDGDSIALVNFEKVFDWARHWGIIATEGDAEVIRLSEVLAGLIDASEKERKSFVQDTTFEVDIKEAYAHGAQFAFNRSNGKLMLLHADGIVNELTIDTLLKGNRERMRKHEPFREWIDFLNCLFEEDEE